MKYILSAIVLVAIVVAVVALMSQGRGECSGCANVITDGMGKLYNAAQAVFSATH